MSTIRHYTDDFKRDAIRYVEDHPEITTKQAAEYLGIPKDTLYGWIKAYRRSQLDETADLTGPLSDTEKELIRLRRENRDLQDALAVLKKAISILNDH